MWTEQEPQVRATQGECLNTILEWVKYISVMAHFNSSLKSSF